ncbi:deoxyribodipyrimidine photo-lyase [Oxalobacter formigenes]|uniref:deoxyribodipyrimidine photo-lyase n=1 Tax=Oxalobacter formigenes TaxID=847 RepID=UPI0022AF33FE|nr:deoxyribodipyrimidine photo-lyase [Oxalobacter formigenes]WAW06100.1 deoxyribodipyrimidine photo-lyase [Oxalobacter formigenes]
MKKQAGNASRKHLVWFRQDLRLTDNRALAAACEDKDATVYALFTAPSGQWEEHGVSARQIAFMHGHLEKLSKGLEGLGIPLVCHVCGNFDEAARFVIDFCQREQIDDVFFNNQYELNEQRRDDWVEDNLPEKVTVNRYDDCLLLPPGAANNRQNEMYKVFTPFKRTFLERLESADTGCLPQPGRRLHSPRIKGASPPFFPCENISFGTQYPVGEEAAIGLLENFCREKVHDYDKTRDRPDLDGTSRVSAYLAMGALSPRQCLNALLAEVPDAIWQSKGGGAVWLNELIWREFYYHLIAAFPRLCRYEPFLEWTDRIVWNANEADFRAWVDGITGYPIVDAAMRELKETGWMHNRLRMIVASFLVKDLLVDWRKGERYFMSQLIDGNLPANNGGWQWSASTGVDAMPWFRIFNPVTQGQKFDPLGHYVRRWLPELKGVPDGDIHTPQLWANKNHVVLDYPDPVVDHRKAREKTLKAFNAARQKAGGNDRPDSGRQGGWQ